MQSVYNLDQLTYLNRSLKLAYPGLHILYGGVGEIFELHFLSHSSYIIMQFVRICFLYFLNSGKSKLLQKWNILFCNAYPHIVCFSGYYFLFLRAHLRKEKHILDRRLIGHDHSQSVNSDL